MKRRQLTWLARYLIWFNTQPTWMIYETRKPRNTFCRPRQNLSCNDNKHQRPLAEMKSEVTGLLDDILSILKREKKTIADLARELGRDYNQVYHWLVVRRYNPSGTAIMELQSWRNKEYVASL